MIICKTPFRVSFTGGGTDQLEWIKLNGKGGIINSSINKYGYIILKDVKTVYDYKYKIRYHLNEEANSYKKIKHPAIKKAIKYYGLEKKNLHITYDSDLPSRSGIGSSSSFVVGLINIIYNLKNKNLSKFKLANEAIYFENKILMENSGMQDQISASYGGLNYIYFSENNFKVKKINISNIKKNILNKSLLFCFVKRYKNSIDIEKKKLLKIARNKNIYSEILDINQHVLHELKSNSKNWYKNLNSYLNYYWELKKKIDNNVSSEQINYLCDNFLNDGADSVKLMGAGGGGFISIFASQKIQQKLLSKYNNLKFVKVEMADNGSKIIKI
tara:strand:+ start:840 stop:1826 length:987 start_codon:yes stop_codon:yes gene_type:complete